MSIVVITGPARSGKSLIANALRNNQGLQKYGTLLIDEGNSGDPKALLEKLLVGVELPDGVVDPGSLPWKPHSMIITVGEQSHLLAEFEKMLPGFMKFFGPVYSVSTSGPSR